VTTETNWRTATDVDALPLFPSDVAVIVAEPAPTPVTAPLAEIVATIGWPLDHVTVGPTREFPETSCSVAVSCCVSPRTSVIALGDTATDSTDVDDCTDGGDCTGAGAAVGCPPPLPCPPHDARARTLGINSERSLALV
jgi:hypothetical protein